MSGGATTIIISQFIFNIALLLIAARIAGDITSKYLKQPAVLGELIAGVIIGPYALGSFLNSPLILNFGEVAFEQVAQAIPGAHATVVHFTLIDVISMLAVIILLFYAGVETDVKKFIKYGPSAGLVAIGGVVFSFSFGYFLTQWMYPQGGQVAALFMGAVLTATSVGITVRVLMDIGKLDTPEGVTILGAAVIDDVIGIIILALVLSIAAGGGEGGIALTGLVKLGATAFIFWFAIVAIGIKFGGLISKYVLGMFDDLYAKAIIALLIGFIIAYVSTFVELHPVIGAYAAGLMFSATADKEVITKHLHGIYAFLVPLFFVSMGMQVDLFQLKDLPMVYGTLLVLLSFVSKIFGCAIFALPAGFNTRGAVRVGLGMMPRGEVGLIVAGMGLLEGAIDQPMYVAAVMVSLLSTLATPPLLKPFFEKGGSGLKSET